jgi:hypothetical protein
MQQRAGEAGGHPRLDTQRQQLAGLARSPRSITQRQQIQSTGVAQRRTIDMPRGDPVVTELHTEDELHQMIGGRFREPGTFAALEELIAAIDNGEYRIESTAFLGGLGVQKNLDGWSTGHPELSSAHHKLGKSQLGALFLRMRPEHQERMLDELGMERGAGPEALARLPSNLISPKTGLGEGTASSDHRTDDPMNNRESSSVGEEFLDLVKDTTGSETPRSRRYRRIADKVARPAQGRQQTAAVRSGDGSDRLTDEEASTLIGSVVEAEMWHHKIEADPSKPSHHAEENWTFAEGRYTKRPVKPIVGELTVEDAARWREARDARVNARKLKKFSDYWLGKKPLSFYAWKEFRGYWNDDLSLDGVMREEYEEYRAPMFASWRYRVKEAAQAQEIPLEQLTFL